MAMEATIFTGWIYDHLLRQWQYISWISPSGMKPPRRGEWAQVGAFERGEMNLTIGKNSPFLDFGHPVI
jgi:hypothetical protein